MANSLARGGQAIAGLGTFTYTIVTAGEYTLSCKTTLPNASGVSIVLKQNATSVVTVGGATANPTPTQSSIGTSMTVLCAAADVLSVVLASSAAADQIPNAVKSVVNLFAGI